MTELRVYTNSVVSSVPILVFLGLLTVLSIGFVLLLWRKGLRDGLRYSTRLLLAEWVFLVLCFSVLFRESGDDYRFNLIPLSSYFDYAENSYLKEMAAINTLNVVMFVPVGLLLGCAFRQMTWWKALAIGAGMSAAIEVLQFIFKRGLCETDDVIHNVVGCMIGYGVVAVWRHLSSAGNHIYK